MTNVWTNCHSVKVAPGSGPRTGAPTGFVRSVVSTLNHRLTTPNKLFEAMAAGVAVVASDLPGMATIVRATDCGVLCDPTDPTEIAAAIRRILDAPEDERLAFGRRGLVASHTTFNWETQVGLLLDEYGRLTGRSW